MLTGSVVTSASGSPIAGAIVSSANGPSVRTNERGEWSLADLPTGTRMLQTRAIGYYPDSRPVDVSGKAPPVRVVLATMKSVLDTVRIVAQRTSRYQQEFEFRQRSGAGYYMDSVKIARTGAIFTTKIFLNVPGVRYDPKTDPAPRMRGLFASQGHPELNPEMWCYPKLYVNGVQGIDFVDLDGFARIESIIGIEIYTTANAPIQYKDGMNSYTEGGCGVILIWTK
jgi:hypothetical protein